MFAPAGQLEGAAKKIKSLKLSAQFKASLNLTVGGDKALPRFFNAFSKNTTSPPAG